MRRRIATAIGLLTSIWPAAVWGTVSLGQLDDFEDGTTMGWAEGFVSPNPPANVASGGPGGVNDGYLSNVSNGSTGAGGRMIMFNRDQWTGDLLSSGVTEVDAMLRATGQSLAVRVAFQGANGTIFASQQAFALPNDGVWRSATFDLSAAGLVAVQGVGTLDSVLANVVEMRLLSAASPSWLGDVLTATLSVDNIYAAPEPATAGLLAIGVLGAAARRRSRR